MNILLFGPPGAGKGTQSQLLVEKLAMVQISTGDLFRSAMKNKTELGLRAQAFVDKGELVPDEITNAMVEEALDGLGNKSFILDGFPRNVAQAKELEKMLAQRGLNLDKAVFLEVPAEQLVKRLSGRRVCKKCGAVYHIEAKRPKKEGICDLCAGELYQRKDDTEEVISNRLAVYEKNTAPLKSYYREIGKLVTLDGNQATDLVFQSVKRKLEGYN